MVQFSNGCIPILGAAVAGKPGFGQVEHCYVGTGLRSFLQPVYASLWGRSCKFAVKDVIAKRILSVTAAQNRHFLQCVLTPGKENTGFFFVLRHTMAVKVTIGNFFGCQRVVPMHAVDKNLYSAVVVLRAIMAIIIHFSQQSTGSAISTKIGCAV